MHLEAGDNSSSLQDHNLFADHQRIAVKLLSVFDDAIKALSPADGLRWSAWKAEDAGAPASIEILQASKVRVLRTCTAVMAALPMWQVGHLRLSADTTCAQATPSALIRTCREE